MSTSSKRPWGEDIDERSVQARIIEEMEDPSEDIDYQPPFRDELEKHETFKNDENWLSPFGDL